MNPKPPSHVVSLFSGAPVKNTGADAILQHMQVKAQQKANRFSKVFTAIEARDITTVSWELLTVAITEIDEKGTTVLGRTTLMELVRQLSSKNNSMLEADKDAALKDVSTWLRKKAE